MKRISVLAVGACLIAMPAAGQSGSGAMQPDSGAMGMNAPDSMDRGAADVGPGAAARGGGSVGTAAERSATTELDASQFGAPSARVNGRVTDINRTTGAVRLQSSSAPLRLHFPAQALSGLQDNQAVVVHIAYSFGETPAAQDIAANRPASGAATQPMAGAPGQTAPGAAASLPAGPVANVADEYALKGTITNIDRNTGLITFTPAPVMMTVYLPRQSLDAIKPGDPVSAEMAYLKTTTTAGDVSTRAGDAPAGQGAAAPQGMHWMKATVTDVDQGRGVFVAQAEQYTLQLPIPTAIQDQIAANKSLGVRLSFEPATCAEPSAM